MDVNRWRALTLTIREADIPQPISPADSYRCRVEGTRSSLQHDALPGENRHLPPHPPPFPLHPNTWVAFHSSDKVIRTSMPFYTTSLPLSSYFSLGFFLCLFLLFFLSTSQVILYFFFPDNNIHTIFFTRRSLVAAVKGWCR